MTNTGNTVIYTGVTNDLERRVWEHRQWVPGTFCGTYKITKLVYFENVDSIEEAIVEEKRIKGGSRRRKIVMIERENPE
ncbi:GIY-YIG nuclease family protein, partial [Candidatus Uhrbacteria bacterium]|nr:GIY-YIG nuclease family protein [Candidatus Uhrbacteria bacterium]